ncbi:hypothetical protein PDG61_09580 [Mycolicibacterium sp. BiH015]|uniref:hypothetical protein n=1 Tax=Mycolicibacterium sp. BiH015 TaxID=3018808 RepID=UPI0022E7A0A7|nr:hypothetical protein [Mycolicibacterium sp. BiH015]MDA2891163.1 hypothetical protein [Mycolicibacterium sp. BiH015]
MTALEELDNELGTQTTLLHWYSAALVNLEDHDGIKHVRRYPPTGVTAQRWGTVEVAIRQMWEALHRMTIILDAARAVRAPGSFLNETAVEAELRHLLRGQPLEVSHEGTSLTAATDPRLSASGEFVSLSDTALSLGTALPAVTEFLCSVEAISNLVAEAVGPLIRQLDEAGLAAPAEITELLAESASDPLSLTPEDVRRRVDQIAENIALYTDWPLAQADTRVQLDELEAALAQAADAGEHAQRRVATSPLPTPDIDVGDLRKQLTALKESDAAALRALRSHIAEALRHARQCEELATGLLERRTELKGRLRVYEAKAARLGIAEDRDVLASGGIAADLLASCPCDLRAATQAVAKYRQLITQKRSSR